jgi:hypothetical protein
MIIRNAMPLGLEVYEVFIPKMAVAIVHAPAERRHAGGFGRVQAGLLKRERRWATGQAGNLAGTGDGNGRKFGSAASPDRKKDTVSAKRLRKAARIRGLRPEKDASGRERKPDAGASAGDETLAGPVARPGSERLDIGRQVCPEASAAEGSPDAAEARDVHALVRVGSAAMPAPFAFCDQ